MSECKVSQTHDGRVVVECDQDHPLASVIKEQARQIRELQNTRRTLAIFKGQLKGFEVRYGDEPQCCTLILDGTLESEIVFTVDKVLAGFLVEKLSDFVDPVQDESLQTQNSSLRIEVETLRASLNRLTR